MADFKGVLVTGGAGFIGSHVVDRLLRRGERVTVLDNLSPRIHPGSRVPDYLSRDARLVVGDVRNADDWVRALEGCDAVIHLAAYQDYGLDFSTFFTVNTVSTALLYELAVSRRMAISRIVVASSQSVYGEGLYRCADHGLLRPGPRSHGSLGLGDWEHRCSVCGRAVEPEWVAETEAMPGNQYGLSKHAQERVALVLGHLHSVPTVALRYSIVQGARQSPHNTYSGALRSFVVQATAGHAPVVFEDGQQLRDYVNVADAAEATIVCLTHPAAAGAAFNVGGERAVSVLELANSVIRVVGVSAEPEVAGLYRVGDCRHVLSSTASIRSLGWYPARQLDQSVAEYVSWYRTRATGADQSRNSLDRMMEAGILRRATGPGRQPKLV